MPFNFTRRVTTAIDDHPIGKLLDSLRMESAFYTSAHLTEPWGLAMPPMPGCMMYHLVLSGNVQFQVEDAVLTLQSGDFVLFPKGDGHTLSDGQCKRFTALSDLPIQCITERYETLSFGGGGTPCHMVCGAMLFQHPLAIKLLGILPPFITIDASTQNANPVVDTVARLLESESRHVAVGAEAVISRLADILVIATMRQHLTQLEQVQTGWINALADDRIGKALNLLHEQADKHWSLEELASAVGMSRSSFAQHFKKLVGNTPMDYLAEWRMSLAYSRLQLTKDTVLAIALDIGYQSETAFSRAFKKMMGKSPMDVRKDYQQSGQTEGNQSQGNQRR